MKNYLITFDHPVKGTAFLTHNQKKFRLIFPAETDDDYVVKIPLEGIEKGKWIINFEWQYNDREYNFKDEVFLN